MLAKELDLKLTRWSKLRSYLKRRDNTNKNKKKEKQRLERERKEREEKRKQIEQFKQQKKQLHSMLNSEMFDDEFLD